MSGRQPGRVPRAYLGVEAKVPRGVRGGQHVARPPERDVVVFLIGMRINRWRRVRSWLPAFLAMPRMLRELAQADLGLLQARTFWSGRVFLVVQHWRSAEELGAYARDTSLSHAPAWAAFNRRAAATGDVGIFHETYVVAREEVESLYANMPVFGLGAALGTVPRGEGGVRTEVHRRLESTEPEYA